MAKLPNGVTQRKDGLYVGRFQYQGIRYNVTDQDMKKCADKLEKMKYEIAEELGLLDRVLEEGWRSLSSKETGRIGGLLARRKRAAGKK